MRCVRRPRARVMASARQHPERLRARAKPDGAARIATRAIPRAAITPTARADARAISACRTPAPSRCVRCVRVTASRRRVHAIPARISRSTPASSIGHARPRRAVRTGPALSSRAERPARAPRDGAVRRVISARAGITQMVPADARRTCVCRIRAAGRIRRRASQWARRRRAFAMQVRTPMAWVAARRTHVYRILASR